MTAAARVSIVVLVTGLVLFGLLSEHDDAQVSRTSFGSVPAGYRGAYEVLAALDLPVGRQVVPPDRLEPETTVWWIEPHGVCGEGSTGETSEFDSARLAAAGWPGRHWVEAGGVAVVMLPQDGPPCASVAGIALPARIDVAAPTEPGATGGDGGRRSSGLFGVDAPAVEEVIDGPGRVRTVRSTGLTTFADAGEWQVRARVDERPYVIEYALGRGRVVVIADATPLQNGWLSAGDAAAWMVDLVSAFGVPRFDEYSHGVRTDGGAASFLLRSPAVWLFAGLAVLGVVVAWRGSMLPPCTAVAGMAAAPVLEPFVDALAALYARSRDYDRVAGRYRDLAVARLCRHLGLPPETSAGALAERLEAGRSVAAVGERLPGDTGCVRSERELRTLVRGLDALVREVGA